LSAGGWVKLKTDSTSLLEFTLEELSMRNDIRDLTYTLDLAKSELLADHHGITTRYEQMYLAMGKEIKYLKFRFAD